MRMLEVTQEDIDNGIPRCNDCPIGLALKRTLGGDCITVDDTSVSVGERRILLPSIARLFIKRFDAGLSVKPITFPLE
ncbi:hypothetical protein LCGC14_0813770 [marine sediment metagenome]|uniref:Uncharacterized protein n=1 Tax=marine sediment metagenome TaxID=412755 RepID=A0A0F9PKY8_9ZZZZ